MINFTVDSNIPLNIESLKKLFYIIFLVSSTSYSQMNLNSNSFSKMETINLHNSKYCYSLRNENIDTLEEKEKLKNNIDVFLGIGYSPIKLNYGFGYFIHPNKEINIQYGGMAFPLALDIYVYSIGMKFYDYKTATVYSLSTGITSPRQNPKSHVGFYLEGSVGYLVDTNVGFYFLPSFKIGGIYRKHEKSIGIIGIDLTLGWFI